MGTGGLVTIIPNLSDFSGKQQIAGISQEWIERLEKREATDYPKKKDWGSDDPKVVQYYQKRSFFNVREKRVLYSAHIDAEISKCILQDMVEEAGGTVLDGNGNRLVLPIDINQRMSFIAAGTADLAHRLLDIFR